MHWVGTVFRDIAEDFCNEGVTSFSGCRQLSPQPLTHDDNDRGRADLSSKRQTKEVCPEKVHPVGCQPRHGVCLKSLRSHEASFLPVSTARLPLDPPIHTETTQSPHNPGYTPCSRETRGHWSCQ